VAEIPTGPLSVHARNVTNEQKRKEWTKQRQKSAERREMAACSFKPQIHGLPANHVKSTSARSRSPRSPKKGKSPPVDDWSRGLSKEQQEAKLKARAQADQQQASDAPAQQQQQQQQQQGVRRASMGANASANAAPGTSSAPPPPPPPPPGRPSVIAPNNAPPPPPGRDRGGKKR